MLQHDASGFLVGQVVSLSQDLAQTQARNLAELRSLRTQVTAIAKAIGAKPGSAGRTHAAAAGGAQRAPAIPGRSAGLPGMAVESTSRMGGAAALLRDARGRFVSAAGQSAALVATASRSDAALKVGGSVAQAPLTITQRDPATGRFIRLRRNPQSGKYEPIQSQSPEPPQAVTSGLAGAVAGAAGVVRDTAVNATDGVDPTLQAMKEVREIFAPIGQGLRTAWNAVSARKKESRQERWYSRILKAIQGKGATNNTTAMASSAPDGPGLGILSRLPGGAAVGRLTAALGGGLLKKLPLIGALVAGGVAVRESLRDDDTSKTPEENHRERFGSVAAAVGAGAGGIAGGLAGVVGGPVGAAIGAAAGAAAGEAIGRKGGELLSQIVPQGAVSGSIRSLMDRGGRAGRLLSAAVSAGITNPIKLANFMGQMSHESMGFTALEENLNYKPKGLLKTFGRYFKGEDDARKVAAQGPEAIANRVYGGRMGNKDPGDGWKYRGRGYVHLTGRANYAKASEALGIDLLNNPDLAAEPDIAAKIAVWYWNTRVAKKGADGDVLAATKAINGGTNGLADRQARVAAYAAIVGSAGAAGAQAMPKPVSVPASVPTRLPSVPDVKLTAPLTHSPEPVLRVSVLDPIGQNIPDRGLAHVVTGGLGS